MDADQYAEPDDGPSVRALASLTRDHNLWMVSGFSMLREAQYLNFALAFAPYGSLVVTYHKQRLFGYVKETEIYPAGACPCVIEVGGLSVARFVSFDLRFPELFREVGPQIDAFVLIANWPSEAGGTGKS